MNNIIELLDILPISYKNKELNLIAYEDLEWYIENCRKPYYNEYLDFNFSRDIAESDLRTKIYELYYGYKLRLRKPGEARLLLKYKNTNIILGGCTIVERDSTTLEISYFLLPEEQHKGYAVEMIKELLISLKNSNIQFNNIIAIVQEDNMQSIKLVTSLGFKQTKSFKGKYKINKIYSIEKRDIE
jgi:RimJ/RimL family protein N-acetyltransferase